MNQEYKLVTAIDIGTSKVVAMVARKFPDGRFEFFGAEKTQSTGVSHGMIRNIEETVNAIKHVIGALEFNQSIKISEVYVALSGNNIKSRTYKSIYYLEKNDEVSTFDLEQLLRNVHRTPLEPGDKIMHAVPMEYYVDNQNSHKMPVGIAAHQLEGYFHLVVGRQLDARNIEKCIQRAGLSMAGLIYAPLATSHAVLTHDEMEAGVVLIDIGAGTTDFALFYDGVIRSSAVIPFGGNVVSADIKEGCSILYKQAETLKLKFGSAMGSMAREDLVIAIPGMEGWESKDISLKSLACIIQARMEEIVEYVAHHIDASGYYDKLGAGIVISGGGSKLRNLTALIKLKTGLDVRIGKPDRYINSEIAPSDETELFSTVAGLILSSSIYAPKKVVEQKLFDTPEESLSKSEAFKKKEPKIKRVKAKSQANFSYFTGDLFDKINKKIANVFNEGDVEM